MLNVVVAHSSQIVEIEIVMTPQPSHIQSRDWMILADERHRVVLAKQWHRRLLVGTLPPGRAQRQDEHCYAPNAMTYAHRDSSGDHHCIAWSQRDILLWMTPFHNVFIVEWQLHLPTIFHAQEINALQVRELSKARAGQCLQYGHIGQQ